MLSKAAAEAQRLRQNWMGLEHYLLAVLAQPGIASDVMAELGVTHARLAAQLELIGTVNGRRIRYVESKGIKSNPASHDVDGWAMGYAAASGRSNPTPEDWLLAIVYSNHGMVASVLHELGVSWADVTEAMRRRGVGIPDLEPEEYRPWRNRQEVEVPKSDWQAVVDVLNKKHPAGSDWRWGFNSRKDRPGKIQFSAEEGIDLEPSLPRREPETANLRQPDVLSRGETVRSDDPCQLSEALAQSLVGGDESCLCALRNGDIKHVVDGVVVVSPRQLPRSIHVQRIVGETNGHLYQEHVGGVRGGTAPSPPLHSHQERVRAFSQQEAGREKLSSLAGETMQRAHRGR